MLASTQKAATLLSGISHYQASMDTINPSISAPSLIEHCAVQSGDAEKDKLRASLGSAILAERPNVKVTCSLVLPAMLHLTYSTADPSITSSQLCTHVQQTIALHG